MGARTHINMHTPSIYTSRTAEPIVSVNAAIAIIASLSTDPSNAWKGQGDVNLALSIIKGKVGLQGKGEREGAMPLAALSPAPRALTRIIAYRTKNAGSEPVGRYP